jgi:hypothetical protein
MEQLKNNSVKIATEDPEKKREMLIRCAGTALNSKLLNSYKV